MTLGADASPVDGRAQFLGGWRLCADVGRAAGPLALSGLTAIMTLGASSVVLGVGAAPRGRSGCGSGFRATTRPGPLRVRPDESLDLRG